MKDLVWKIISGVALPLIFALGGWVWNVNTELVELKAQAKARNEKVEVMYKVIVLDKLGEQ